MTPHSGLCCLSQPRQQSHPVQPSWTMHMAQGFARHQAWFWSCPTQRLRAQVTSLMVSEDTAVDRNLFTPLGSTDAEGNNTV